MGAVEGRSVGAVAAAKEENSSYASNSVRFCGVGWEDR
jgi:hypothetical protein